MISFTYREEGIVYFMKFLIVILFFSGMMLGCKNSKNITFCEGVSTEGKGINCGLKFETGDLTVIIKDKGPFETAKISIDVYEISKTAETKIDSLPLDVKPDNNTVSVNLSFYRSGKYSVKASKEGKNFADGDIEIIEQ